MRRRGRNLPACAEGFLGASSLGAAESSPGAAESEEVEGGSDCASSGFLRSAAWSDIVSFVCGS